MKLFFSRYPFLCLLCSLFIVCQSCKEKTDEPPMPAPARSTILVYMAANNSLGDSGADAADIAEMQQAVDNGALHDGDRLLIFHAATDGTQNLYELTSEGKILVKEYSSDTYSIASDRMAQVFSDAKDYAPATHFGLIMWSHAMGWTQNGQLDNGPSASVKTWGEDRGHTMNITTLRRVLEKSPWEWVYFDCCYMGCAEVAYELSPVLNRMVASASEVPLDGMPYDKNLPLLFGPNPDLAGAASNTLAYYNTKTGMARTCTIGVFNLEGMKTLGEITTKIYEACNPATATDASALLPLSTDSRPLFYDFGVFVRSQAALNDVDSELVDEWNRAYNNVILYHGATPRLWNTINLSGFTGMSTFVPRSESEQTLRGYNTLSWWSDVAHLLF